MSFKKEFLDLLDKDEEFRYAIAGYLGLGDLIKRLDKQQETMEKTLASMEKLWESNNKLWEEVKALREGQEALKSTTDLLSRRMNRLEVEVDSFGNAVGRTLEDYTASFVKIILEERGYDGKSLKVGKKLLEADGRQIEIDVFCEKPLVVGEVTTYLSSESEAQAEFEKLIDHVAVAEKLFNKKALLKLLSVGNAPSEAVGYLKARCKEAGITFVYGKELVERI